MKKLAELRIENKDGEVRGKYIFDRNSRLKYCELGDNAIKYNYKKTEDTPSGIRVYYKSDLILDIKIQRKMDCYKFMIISAINKYIIYDNNDGFVECKNVEHFIISLWRYLDLELKKCYFRVKMLRKNLDFALEFNTDDLVTGNTSCNLKSFDTNSGFECMILDKNDRLLCLRDQSGEVIKFINYEYGKKTSEIRCSEEPDSQEYKVTYTYGSDIFSIKKDGESTITYIYDMFGNIELKKIGGKIVKRYEIDNITGRIKKCRDIINNEDLYYFYEYYNK